jgi:nitrate/nitrite-specific signal transduction histidine kinase
MKLKGLFWILSVLLIGILSALAYKVFYADSPFYLFVVIEGLIVITAIYLVVFYLRIIKPLQIIGNGMDLLKEQDFSSRLRRVGQSDADRIVDIFNKMMEQLKTAFVHLKKLPVNH